jgi:hypothetical protein
MIRVSEEIPMKRIVLGLLAAATLSIGVATPAAAQIRFSVGTGGFSVGNTPGYPYGYGYGSPYPYGRSYYGSSVVIGRSHSAPATRYVETAPAPYTGPGVTIRNPAESGAQLSYTIDSRHGYEIATGQTQHLATKPSYLVEFDRGGSFGRARYTISEGLYDFTPTDHGWELYRQPDVAAEAERVKTNPLPTAPTP